MAIVNYSVPEDVKRTFNETFKGRNKSAVIAELMREAVRRARRRDQSHEAIEQILKRRRGRKILSDDEVRAARQDPRP